MRNKLRQLKEQREKFTGTFERFGMKSGWNGFSKETILLKDIKNENGEIVTEHLWFNKTKGFDSLNLTENIIVEFYARVKEYFKGYKGYREEVQFERPIEKDYKLSHPTKIKIIEND